MKVFFILVATCLLGFCHCKRSRAITDRPVTDELDDFAEDEVVNECHIGEKRRSGLRGRGQSWDMDSTAVYEEEYTRSFSRRRNDESIAYIAAEDSRRLPYSRHTITLDIFSLTSSLCQCFGYSFAGNAMRLVVPKNGITVTQIMKGEENVWTPSSGEIFDHAKVYLNKDDEPELVLVVAKTSTKVKEHYLELKDGEEWQDCTGNHEEMIEDLRNPVQCISDFDIDLFAYEDTDECRIFEVDLLGVTTKHFYPRPGHFATRVMDGNRELWKSPKYSHQSGSKVLRSSKYDDRCLSCLIYKKGIVELLEVTVVEYGSTQYKYFENTFGSWNEIDKKVFDKKADETQYEEYEEPISYFASKVDTSLFYIEEAEEDTVKFLKLTVKYGVKATELKYDEKQIWSSTWMVGSPCSSALLYMDKGRPTLAVIKTRSSSGTKSTVYKYYDGNKWRDTKEDDHKEKLAELKEKCRPGRILDISKKNSSVGTYYYHCHHNTCLHTFDLYNVNVAKVVDGEYIIWRATADTDQKCTHVQIAVVGDRETLTLTIQSDRERLIKFRKEGRRWQRV
ncbi:signal peptide containing protein [Theileria equi strain WA]|uniref:Signal peptide containing protein n=1 Tax=Theileria equi strain WA TaxID=1537102 RepID=L1LAG1_THEEQ|nr:signal peptide containing protein [Theileria equi strain WA]EKX72245.1 signal peptide containing protein [Theileria equi strain WA]|eukprot:XP_004831697.1 signal peptide containing protein [Theileria equi strain WA]